MEEAAAYERLTKVFSSVFSNDAIWLRHEMTTGDLPAWDSVSHLHLVIAVEREFGMRFDGRELRTLNCVGDMVEIIRRRGA